MLDETDTEPRILSRKPNKFRFRTNDDGNLRERNGLMFIGDVKEEKIKWLWEPYIPFGRITMLGGDPGAGKSFITAALAADLSRGRALPGEEEGVRPTMSVLMLSVEDDPADTLRPRLRALDADLCKISFSTEDIVLDGEGLSAIRDMIRSTKARLVILDPIVAFLGPKMDMNRANEVRHIMKGLAKIAKDEGVAILVVRHNRKEQAGSSSKAIYSGMGSIDFTASVRSELAVTEAKAGHKFMNHIKANSGRKGNSLTYTITSNEDGSPNFKWGGFAAWPPHGATTAKVISTRFKNEYAIKRWLYDLLVSCPNGELAKNVFAKGQLAGYTDTKIIHVKKGIANSVKMGSEWLWMLDPNAKPPVDPADKPVLG